jgi:hypothetical protein
MAFLFPDAMVDGLMREVEHKPSNVVPIKDRAPSIAALETKLEELAYIEEELISAAIANGNDVQRSPSAPPQAVLGVKVVDATKASRAT